MSELLESIRGDTELDTTLTVKINSDVKRNLIKFAKRHKISMGKMVRAGLKMVEVEINKEINDETR